MEKKNNLKCWLILDREGCAYALVWAETRNQARSAGHPYVWVGDYAYVWAGDYGGYGEVVALRAPPLDDKRHLFLSLPHARDHDHGACSISVSPHTVQEIMVANGSISVSPHTVH